MAMSNLKNRVKELSTKIEFMDSREKGDFSKLVGKTVTINDYGFLQDNGKAYIVFTVEEDKENFYFGGMILTDQMKQLDEDGFHDDIVREGLPVKFDTKKSKGKREYTTVEFYPEA